MTCLVGHVDKKQASLFYFFCGSSPWDATCCLNLNSFLYTDLTLDLSPISLDGYISNSETFPLFVPYFRTEIVEDRNTVRNQCVRNEWGTNRP